MIQIHRRCDLICGDFILTYSTKHRYVGIGVVAEGDIVRYNYILDWRRDRNVEIWRKEAHDMLEVMMYADNNCTFKLTEDEIHKHVYMEEI